MKVEKDINMKINESINKRFLAVILAAGMIFGTVSCGKKTGGNTAAASDNKAVSTETAAEVDVKNVTFEPDPEFTYDESLQFNEVKKVGDDIVFATYIFEEMVLDEASDTDAAIDIDKAVIPGEIYVKPVAGGSEKLIYKSPEGMGIKKILDVNGNIGIALDDGNKMTLKTIDKEGNELSSVNLAELNKNVKDEYINSMSVTETGEIAVVTDSKFILLNKDGKEILNKQFSGFGMGSVITQDGKLVVFSNGNSAFVDATVYDPKTGEDKESYSIKANYISGDAIQTGFGDYDFIYKGDDGLYGYKMAEQTAELLCNFNASNIDGTEAMNVMMLSDDRFIISGFNLSGSNIDAYRKVDPANVKDVKTLKLACVYSDIDLKQNITEFNKTHPDIRIELKDYSNEEDPYLKFSADLAAGNVPDLYDVSLDVGGMSIEEAVKKNMLEDLTQYIENDPDISEDDFLESIMNYTKIDGKIYYIPSAFEINSLMAKKSEMGDKTGWTLEEMIEYINSKPESARLFEMDNKEYALMRILYSCSDEFVDWEKGECYFDSPLFKELLKITNRGSNEEPDWGNTDYVDDLKSGEQLFLTGIVNPNNWNVYKVYFGDEVNCIGFPNKDRAGLRCQMYDAVAISTTCADKEAAWEFVKFCVSKEREGQNYMSGVGMPTRKDVFEAYMKAVTTTEDYTDEFGNDIFPNNGTYEMGGVTADVKPLTTEEAEQFRDFVDRVAPIEYMDDGIISIVLEEAGGYYSGDKSIDDVCATIQDRVTTYIKENN